MEAGRYDVNQQTQEGEQFDGHANLCSSSEVFDVVVDPLTDFRVLDLNSTPSSPQQSFNLPTSISSLHSTSEGTPVDIPPRSRLFSLDSSSHLMTGDVKKAASLPPSPYQLPGRSILKFFETNLWSSDVSLSSGSGTDCGRDRAGGSSGGGNSNHHRLVVPEVHRFGSNPPCAGSPHDLASCPVASVPASQKNCQTEKLVGRGSRIEINEKYDALKALSQASSALALTETLIGPLRIPPVSQDILDEVVCKMEKKKSSLSLIYNGGAPHKETGCSASEEVHSNLPNFANPVNKPFTTEQYPPLSGDQLRSSTNITTDNVGDARYGTKLPLGSLPSVLEPDIHRSTKLNGGIPSPPKVFTSLNAGNTPKLDIRVSSCDPQVNNGGMVSTKERSNASRVIAVPVGMSDQGPVEIYKEVHPYPASSITTVVERCSYIGQTSVQGNLKPPCGTKKRKKHSQKLKNRLGNDLHLSRSSLTSSSSVASDSTIVSKNSSELTPTTRSLASSSKISLNDSRSDCGGSVSKPILSAAIMQMRQALESVSTASDNRSDKSSGGGLDIASNFSDTSSNLSTLSDLSGYEDEYIRIKRLVSDRVIPPEDYQKLLTKTNAKSQVSKPVPSVDYEKIIRDLHAQKEDLEIQLHRLSIQVQNAVREKELYQQQLELMNTKITETNQKQYFEVLKQRANLEGQLEMLKQELENSVYEKNQLQTKITDVAKEAEVSNSEAAAAKETEAAMSARLLKYEEANKDLEKQLDVAQSEVEKRKKEHEKTKEELVVASDKNISLEQSFVQLQEKDNSMMAEIKGLKSRLSNLQEEYQTSIQAQHQIEAAASKTSSELKAAQNSSLWYQEQLQLAQTARADIQQELVEARMSIAKLSSERESLDIKVQTLVREAEDGQARAVREKASLLAHLEALQADMAEREALVSQMERDRGNDTKLMEDRRQRLEQDRQRIHKLRLDLSDTERQLDSLKDDLKHKCILISKYEKELKDLRTLDAVNQEVLGERDARILNLEQALSESKLLISNAQQDIKQKALDITALKEDKSKLEVAFAAANNEKREVDDAIIKVREDMTKLSSNFYRMKHDIAVKERQMETYKKETEDFKQLNETLVKKYESLELKVKDDVEKRKLLQEVESLKKEIKDLATEKEKANSEVTEVKRSLKTLEIEKKGLAEAVRLREEQIQNMQGSLENYREAILKKDEELYVIHEQNSSLEKSYTELRRNWDALKDDNVALRQEAEAYAEHEKAQKREMADLKESVQKERKLKQNLEKKMEMALKTQEEDHAKLAKEKVDLEKRSSELHEDVKILTEEKLNILEALESLKRDHTKLGNELEVAQQERTRAETSLKETKSELDASQQGSSNSTEMVKVLEGRMEVLLKENSSLTSRLATIQNERHVRISELENLLQAKEKDVAEVKNIIVEKDALVSKLAVEKEEISGQVKTLTTENSQLKEKLTSAENLSKEGTSTQQSKESPKKHGRNYDHLQKEFSTLQVKYNNTDAKLKEVTKQKESLQTTMKNTKKESLLMKARTKEFESLKARCKELESSKVSSEELRAFEMKCSEIESKLKFEEEKVISLEASLTDKERLVCDLENREGDFNQQINALEGEKRTLQLKISTLEEICQKSQEDLNHHQTRLKVTESERDEWMVKYESLRDIIPERDTNTQRAVQLDASSSHVLGNSQETHSVSPLDNNSTPVNVSRPGVEYIKDVTQLPIANGSQFDKTMADLQAQVSLTSKALQNKEQQICDLQNQISLLQAGEASSSATVAASQEHVPYSGDTIPMQVHQQKVHSLLEKIKQLQEMKKDSSYAVNREAVDHKDAISNEVQVLLDEVKNLESSVSLKENELDKAQAKVTEFQEKHRRYESNVRLLTRKLKEHMKGRKAAEKEIQVQAENHQCLMNEEHQRYSVLRCRCIELEGRCESLEGQVGSLETEVEEVRSALNNARQEAEDHHQNTLQLQKELGKLQEQSKTLDCLRSEINASGEKMQEKERRIKELDKELQELTSHTRKTQDATERLKLAIEQHQSEKTLLQGKYNDVEASLTQVMQDLKSKAEENNRLNQTVTNLESTKSELMEKSSVAEGQCHQISIELQNLKEALFKMTSENQLAKVQLQESQAKTKALENHIKVVEGELKVSKEEITLSKERQSGLEASHQVKLNQLEESISRSRQEVVNLSTQLGQVQKERVSFQTQATELRMALHSALAQLKTFEAEQEARVAIQSEVGEIPSPSPLDLAALTELMERSVRPARSEAPLSSLQSCLSNLKAEVATLQSQLQTKGKELDASSLLDEEGEGATLNKAAVAPCRSTSGSEIV